MSSRPTTSQPSIVRDPEILGEEVRWALWTALRRTGQDNACREGEGKDSTGCAIRVGDTRSDDSRR